MMKGAATATGSLPLAKRNIYRGALLSYDGRVRLVSCSLTYSAPVEALEASNSVDQQPSRSFSRFTSA